MNDFAIRSRMTSASVVLLFSVFAFIDMCLRIRPKQIHSFDGAFNICLRSLILLRQSVRQHDHLATVEKVEHPVLDMPSLGAQFINSISQIRVCNTYLD